MTAARGRFLEIDSAAYHRDPSEVPSLSSSIAVELIKKSPRHAWQKHPRLGGGGSGETTDALDDGTLIHALVLGAGGERIAVLDVDSFRTNAAKEARDAAQAEGKTVVKAKDYEQACKVAEIIKERIADQGIKLAGRSEEKIEWLEETAEGEQLVCRAMLDHWTPDFNGPPSAAILDLKTTRDATLRGCQKAIAEYAYDIQRAAYCSALAAAMPEAIGRIKFTFLFAELTPPYVVTPIELNGQWRNIGEIRWERACATWARCMKGGAHIKNWPGPTTGTTRIRAPEWVLSDSALLIGDDDNDANV